MDWMAGILLYTYGIIIAVAPRSSQRRQTVIAGASVTRPKTLLARHRCERHGGSLRSRPVDLTALQDEGRFASYRPPSGVWTGRRTFPNICVSGQRPRSWRAAGESRMQDWSPGLVDFCGLLRHDRFHRWRRCSVLTRSGQKIRASCPSLSMVRARRDPREPTDDPSRNLSPLHGRLTPTLPKSHSSPSPVSSASTTSFSVSSSPAARPEPVVADAAVAAPPVVASSPPMRSRPWPRPGCGSSHTVPGWLG